MSDVFAAACPAEHGLRVQYDLPSCQRSVIKLPLRGDTLHGFLCQFRSPKNFANPLRAWQAVLGNARMRREERYKLENKEAGTRKKKLI